MNNNIIIEGLWGAGKTSIAGYYCKQYNYTLIPEPLHDEKTDKRLEDWYLEAHRERQSWLKSDSPIILERSFLSTFAFSYALGSHVPDEKYINDLGKALKINKALVVYLKTGDDFMVKEERIVKYRETIKNILTIPNSRQKYEEWFEKILPEKYGIIPFVLNIYENGERRALNKIAEDIHLCLVNERIAQANVVCFTRALTNDGSPRILLLKRNSKKKGFWQTVTGGIKPGENGYDAAGREVEEETGIVSDDKAIYSSYSYSFMGEEGYRLYEYVFGMEIKNPEKVRISEEHEVFEWLDPEEAKSRLIFEENRIAIDEILKKATL